MSIVWSKLQFTIILCGLGNHPPAAAFLLIFFKLGWWDGIMANYNVYNVHTYSGFVLAVHIIHNTCMCACTHV